MKFCNETIVITDPCYMKRSLALMKRSTIYGDWSCMVYPGKLDESKDPAEWDKHYFEFFHEYNFTGKTAEEQAKLSEDYKAFREAWSSKILGEFCADAGMVGVFRYDLLADSDKAWVKEHPLCACVIENFTGDIDFLVRDNSVYVVGSGEKPFFSTQSGF